MPNNNKTFAELSTELDQILNESTGLWSDSDRVFEWWRRLEEAEGVNFTDAFELYRQSN